MFAARHAAIFGGYLAGVLHEQGDRAGARGGYARAIAELDELGDVRFGWLFRACLGAVEATLSDAEGAAAAFDAAAERLDRVADPALLLALRVRRRWSSRRRRRKFDVLLFAGARTNQ